MFTRLLRYCLGEPQFCDQRTKAAVIRAYPDSFVAAELVVGGENWAVLRPLGAAQAFGSKARRAEIWTDLLTETEPSGIEPLVNAISNAVLGSSNPPHLRLAHRTVRWLDILQWIARDQRCHSKHALEWRDADTESGNPELQKEDAAIVLKTVTGLLSPQERALIDMHNGLLASKRTIDTELDDVRRDIKAEERFMNRELVKEAGAAAAQDTPLAVAERVAGRIKSLQSLLKDVAEIYKIASLEAAQLDAVRANADLARQISTKENEKELIGAQLSTDSSAPNQTIPNLLYERCSLDADTCPVKKAAVKVGLPLPLRPERNEEMRGRVATLVSEIAGLREQHAGGTATESNATAALKAARKRARRHEAAINRQIANFKRLSRLSGTHDRRAERLSFLVKESSRLDREQKESLDAQAEVRDSLEVEQLWLNGQFDNVIKFLIGPDYAGRVRIDSKAIRLFGDSDQSSSGEAVRASTLVLGLDLACFAAATEGHGFMPRFMVLDSPRESDMEAPIFGRVFRFLSELSHGQVLPNFQVIVTTTTPPPTGSIDDAAIILNLSSAVMVRMPCFANCFDEASLHRNWELPDAKFDWNVNAPAGTVRSGVGTSAQGAGGVNRPR